MHILPKMRRLLSVSFGCALAASSASAGELLHSGGQTINVAGANGTLNGVTGEDQSTLIVTIGAEFVSQQDAITEVTFAGHRLLPAIQQSQTISSASIWYLVNPPVTTSAVEVTFSSNPAGNQASVFHYTFSGIDPANPLLATEATGYAASDQAAHSMPLGSGPAVVIDALTTNNRTSPILWGSEQTGGFVDNILGRGSATHASRYELDLSGLHSPEAHWEEFNRAIHVSAAFSTPEEIFFTSPTVTTLAYTGQSPIAIQTITAYDPAPGLIAYALSGGADVNLFTLDSSSGQLEANEILAPGRYQVIVTATNSGDGGAVSQALTVIVNDVIPVVTDDFLSVSGATGTAGTFRAGDTVTVTWDNSPLGDNNRGILSVSVDFTAFGGPSQSYATEFEGVWRSSYSLPVGFIDIPDAQLSITATNIIGPNTFSYSTTYAVDTEPPAITPEHLRVTAGDGDGDGDGNLFTNGDLITVIWNDAGGDENLDLIQAARFDFTGLGGSEQEATEVPVGSRIWEASYEVGYNSIIGDDLRLQATVTDDAGNTSTTMLSEVLTISVARIRIFPVAGVAEEGSLSRIATYDIAPDTAPTSGIEITIEADGNSEISVGGDSFAATVTLVLDGTTPQPVSVRALDDEEREGPHLSTITHIVSNSSDPRYPLDLTIPDQMIPLRDTNTGIISHALTTASSQGRIEATFTHEGPAFPALVVVGFAAEGGARAPAVSGAEVEINGESTQLTSKGGTGIFDTVGQIGLWCGQVEVLPAGTHTITISTNVDPARSGTNLWIVPGRPLIRDNQTAVYLDDQNGGAFTGGESGSVGFNLNAGEVLIEAGEDPGPRALNTENADFVLGMTMAGNENGGFIEAIEGWSSYQRDIHFQSGRFSVLHGPVDGSNARLGIELSEGYTRYGIAALALDLDEVIPSGEPLLLDLGPGGAGNLLLGAYNLNPGSAYLVKYNLEDGSFGGLFGELVSSVTEAVISGRAPEGSVFQLIEIEQVDTDRDGLWDDCELIIGTEPDQEDTDGDGLRDGTELEIGTDPLNNDSDGDDLIDGSELEVGTDPNNPDTDGDGLNDSREVASGTDPVDSDSDDDGLSDSAESVFGTDPNNPDTDDDGFLDVVETNTGIFVSISNTGTDPLVADTDEDGLLDGLELTFGRDPLTAEQPRLVNVFFDENGEGNILFENLTPEGTYHVISSTDGRTFLPLPGSEFVATQANVTVGALSLPFTPGQPPRLIIKITEGAIPTP